MSCDAAGDSRRNCFALVSYIPDPLAKFLDDLRSEFVPGCKPHAHVTILPPRPLNHGDPPSAAELLRSIASDFPPFEIEVREIEIFPVTDVVFLGIGEGWDQLLRMHQAMNTGPFLYQEPFPYHPHITVAQEVGRIEAERMAETARQRLRQFTHNRRYRVDALTFVRANGCAEWTDLARCELGAVPSIR